MQVGEIGSVKALMQNLPGLKKSKVGGLAEEEGKREREVHRAPDYVAL